ncbi:MAG: serine--tRNA ligase, partial [Deltaproteobacteria bacterium]|nr:serine--tRNA ligase [Deltaproteobacteria bacterium]
MLDPRILESRRDEIVASCKSRHVDVDVDAAITAQRRVTEIQTELNGLNQRRNEHQAGGKRKLEPAEREAHVAEGRQLKEEVASLEKRLADERAVLQPLMLAIPNFLHPDSPQGGEADFNELRRVAEPRKFEFEPLDHLGLNEKLDLFDFEAGAKVSGQKWYFLKNEAVLLELALELALQRMALDFVMEAGFTPFATPDVARKEIVDGLAFSPRGSESQIYSIEGTDLDLIGTAEITLGGINADVLLDEGDLPLRMSGISHCFRTEAGSAGRESKGLYRVHQFSKVEMFAITRPEDS